MKEQDMHRIAGLIIDNIEGGYYHPDMKPNLKNGDLMLDSGETMFGLDRKNGGADITSSEDGRRFWSVIDTYYTPYHGNTAYYNDMADGKRIPSQVGQELRTLAARLMISRLGRYSSALSDGARSMVFANPRLFLQFLYACWNGVGNFNTFANLVNAAYANGERSAIAFFNLIQAARRSKGYHFSQGADKLDAIAAQLSDNGGGHGWLLWLGLGAFAVALLTTSKRKSK